MGGLDKIDLEDFARGADILFITNQFLDMPRVVDQIVEFAASIVSRTVLATYNVLD